MEQLYLPFNPGDHLLNDPLFWEKANEVFLQAEGQSAALLDALRKCEVITREILDTRVINLSQIPRWSPRRPLPSFR